MGETTAADEASRAVTDPSGAPNNGVRARWLRVHVSAGLQSWKLASLVGLVCLVAAALRLAPDSGISLDEEVHREYGNLILAWFRSGFVDTDAANFGNLTRYGGLFDLVAQWFVSHVAAPWGLFETRHVLTALVAVLGIVATWKIANCLGGARAGFLGAAFLALTPTWVGHGLFNPKDIPFATAAAFAVYATVRICMQPAPLSWRDAALAGLCIGVALAVRPGGMFLLGYPLMVSVARLIADAFVQRRRGEPTRAGRAIVSMILRLSCALAIAWTLMLSTWPWAQLAPFQRPFQAAAEAAHFEWKNQVLFDGHRINSYELPARYLPTWFAITLPEIYVLALMCALAGLVCVVRARVFDPSRTLCILFLIVCIAAPCIVVAIERPIIYDAHRHFLFLLPPLAALSGIALSYVFGQVWASKSIRAALATCFLALAGLTIFDMARLHPYEYVYFNRLFGGLPAAAGRFDTDYWGLGYREAVGWVVANAHATSAKPITIAICHSSWQIDYYKKRWPEISDRFQVVYGVYNNDAAEIFISTTRDNRHKAPGEVIHKVERQGVALVYVVQRQLSPSLQH
jgi:hypothetical protein